MSLRPLPDFLKRGDRELGLGQPRRRAVHPGLVGSGEPLPENGGTAREVELLREWLAHVEAGRLGG